MILRHDPVHVHPVPLDAGDRHVGLHRPRHRVLRVCHGPQRLRMAESEYAAWKCIFYAPSLRPLTWPPLPSHRPSLPAGGLTACEFFRSSRYTDLRRRGSPPLFIFSYFMNGRRCSGLHTPPPPPSLYLRSALLISPRRTLLAYPATIDVIITLLFTSVIILPCNSIPNWIRTRDVRTTSVCVHARACVRRHACAK